MSETRTFPLADILSVTTGKLLSHRHMDGIYEILDHMTDESLMTHQLPRAQAACQPHLLQQHPQLEGVTPSPDLDRANIYTWLADAERQYGDSLPVAPLPESAWQQRNPIEDLCDMIGPEKVIVAPLPPERD